MTTKEIVATLMESPYYFRLSLEKRLMEIRLIRRFMGSKKD